MMQSAMMKLHDAATWCCALRPH